jgi:hypothetical protein
MRTSPLATSVPVQGFESHPDYARQSRAILIVDEPRDSGLGAEDGRVTGADVLFVTLFGYVVTLWSGRAA